MSESIREYSTVSRGKRFRGVCEFYCRFIRALKRYRVTREENIGTHIAINERLFYEKRSVIIQAGSWKIQTLRLFFDFV